VLEPIFERDFADGSYGFRPRRGAKDALRRVNRQLRAGRTWVVDADIRSYFDTIPHERLMELVRSKVADGRVLRLIEAFLKQQVMETAASWTPAAGSPQGAVLSPLLSNIYLDPLDHVTAGAGYELVRYADDFIVLCESRPKAEEALAVIQQWMADAGLTLHPDKTRIVAATARGGFDFLGYHFERGKRWPSRKSMGKLRAALRPKTRRANGESLDAIIDQVNRTLRGWFAYFKHSLPSTFPGVDGWVRMRLRSILRKRQGGRGRGRGDDHQRWPNAYFAEHGLYSLVEAYDAACQSVRR
jgi:RNA-directed DNA polymerase